MLRVALVLSFVLPACGDDPDAPAAPGDAAPLDARADGPRPDGRLPAEAWVDAAVDAARPEPDAASPDLDAARSEPDAARGPDAAQPDAAAVEPDAAPLTAAECFADDFAQPSPIAIDYEQFGPVVGSHCAGTNHQDVANVERVVFVGDSVTVGTPPTPGPQSYRSILAGRLARFFGLMPPDPLWNEVDLIAGRALVAESGDFASCAKWGARTDDLLRDNHQITDCIPPEQRHKRHLVIMTTGGNDVASFTKDGIDGVPVVQIWEDVREFVQLQRDAVAWIKDPENLPGGGDVVFANMFEFTDGTGDVGACPAAGLAGFGAEWEDQDALEDMVVWANEQFMSIAVDTGSDMVFMLESFCGHGFNHQDPEGPCYRGPDAELWFDLSCIHPNPTGHLAIADLFTATIEE